MQTARKERNIMAREGLMDDTGYRGFNECSRQEECNKEAYEQGRDDMAEETYLELKDALDNLNNDLSLEKTVEFVAKVREIAEGLKWQKNDRK